MAENLTAGHRLGSSFTGRTSTAAQCGMAVATGDFIDLSSDDDDDNGQA
jgi:hypothetical protein